MDLSLDLALKVGRLERQAGSGDNAPSRRNRATASRFMAILLIQAAYTGYTL
jgi:hypothetical protein